MRHNSPNGKNDRPSGGLGMAYITEKGLARRAYEQATLSHGVNSPEASIARQRLDAIRRRFQV